MSPGDFAQEHQLWGKCWNMWTIRVKKSAVFTHNFSFQVSFKELNFFSKRSSTEPLHHPRRAESWDKAYQLLLKCLQPRRAMMHLLSATFVGSLSERGAGHAADWVRSRLAQIYFKLRLQKEPLLKHVWDKACAQTRQNRSCILSASSHADMLFCVEWVL